MRYRVFNTVGLIILQFVMSCGIAMSQTAEKYVDQGNKLYAEDKFDEAELDYMRAIKEDAEMTQGIFNLGDATYKQERYDDAIVRFRSIAESGESDATRAAAWHNLGNAYYKNQDAEKAIEAYKQALRLNGTDEDTKYNLALARQQQQQQQKQDQGDKDDQQKQDQQDQGDKGDQQKQDQQDQGDKGDQQKQDQQDQGDKSDQQKQDQQDQGDQQRNAQPKDGEQNQMSKEEMQRILESLDQDEKAVQKKVNKQRVKGQKGKVDKDW